MQNTKNTPSLNSVKIVDTIELKRNRKFVEIINRFMYTFNKSNADKQNKLWKCPPKYTCLIRITMCQSI